MSNKQASPLLPATTAPADRVQHVVICPDHPAGKGLMAGLVETLDAELVVAELDRECPNIELHAMRSGAPVDIGPVIEDKTPYYRRFEKRYR